jgi:hypothetical protein
MLNSFDFLLTLTSATTSDVHVLLSCTGVVKQNWRTVH